MLSRNEKSEEKIPFKCFLRVYIKEDLIKMDLHTF
jgi:hypothetical protein